jgi:hypothetical protein
MTAFQEHFRGADLDRLSTTTTGTAGYHGTANHLETTARVPIDHHAANNAQIIAEAVRRIQVALAACGVRPFKGTPATGRTRNQQLLYCWTHGSTSNLRHTISLLSFNHPRVDGHHQTATAAANKMGGSTRVCGVRKTNGTSNSKIIE